MAITINGTTGISGVDGSAGTPALQGSDPNTGIYSPGADQVAVATNGVGRLFVNASGNVGVGVTPSELLHIRSGSDPTIRIDNTDSTSRQGYITLANTGDMEFRARSNASDGQFIFYGYGGTADSEKVRIDSSGNLKFNSGFGSVATAYGVRAWVNFNASGTLTVRGSGNISSVTDNGVGQFAPNFTNAMPDTNYAGVCSHNSISLGNDGAQASPNTTSAAFVQTGSNSAWRDPTVVCVAFFR